MQTFSVILLALFDTSYRFEVADTLHLKKRDRTVVNSMLRKFLTRLDAENRPFSGIKHNPIKYSSMESSTACDSTEA